MTYKKQSFIAFPIEKIVGDFLLLKQSSLMTVLIETVFVDGFLKEKSHGG